MIEQFYLTLTSTTTPSQSGPGSNGNKEVLNIPQSSRTETSPSVGLVSYTGHKLSLWLFLVPKIERPLCDHPSGTVDNMQYIMTNKLKSVSVEDFQPWFQN